MNSKCRTILGVIMLFIVFSISAYYIISELSGAGRTDEENVTLTNEMQKNYLSPISVSSFPIDKSEALANPAVLLNVELTTAKPISVKASIQKAVAGAYALRDGITDRVSSIGTLLYPVVKARLMEQAKSAALEGHFRTLDNHENYVQMKSQQELDNTIHHLFDNLFMTDDSKIDAYLNVREVPDGNVVGRMYPQTGGTLLDIQNGWAMISSGEVTGWVNMEYIITGTQVLQSGAQLTVVVDEERLMLRYEADAESTLVDVLEKGTEVPFQNYSAGWVFVSYKDMSGYLKAEYVHLRAGANTAVPMSEELWRETVASSGTIEEQPMPAAEVPAAEVPEAEAAVAEDAAPAVVEPSADDLARQRIDSIYAEGRSTMAPIYLSANDIYLLSCVIMMEAGNECYEGKLAVAGVVLNRLRSGIWGSTLNEVIYAPKQFTGAGTGALAGFLASGPNEESVRAAYEACAGIHNIGGYLYFCSIKSANYEQYSNYLVIQRQCFYAK